MKTIAFAAALAITAQQAVASTCHVLAFSAGSEESAYMAGVLKGLVQAKGTSATSYNAVTGVSGGGVNAAILANYAIGQEAAAADRMITFWENASNSALYKDWLGGVAQGLLMEGGLYNDKPLKKFLESELVDITGTQRFVDVGITNVLTGNYDGFVNENLTANL